MKRIAIPIVDNLLSEYFGECNYYELFEIEGNNIQKRSFELPQGKNITDIPEWLSQQGVTDVIAYKVNTKIVSLFTSRKLNLFLGVPKHSPDKLIEDYLNGKLESDKGIIEELTNN